MYSTFIYLYLPVCACGLYVDDVCVYAGGGEACVQGQSDGVGLSGEVFLHFHCRLTVF